MAITAYGMGPTINATQWSKLMQMLGDAGAGMSVKSGFAPAAATGTRLISLTAGDAIAAGVLVESTVTETITLAANAGSVSRIDIVALELTWAGSTAQLVSVQGSPAASPVAPVLVQTPGVKWQIPLAEVIVRAGVGQIAAADVADVRPVYDTGWVSVALTNGWEGSLQVRRRGVDIRSKGTVTATSSATGTIAVLPKRFRPPQMAGRLARHNSVSRPSCHVNFHPTGEVIVSLGSAASQVAAGVAVYLDSVAPWDAD